MSTAAQPSALTLDELDRRVRKVEPAALLVPERILRRVIKSHRRLGGLGLRVPHRKSYILDRQSLLAIATASELRLDDSPQDDPLILLPRPTGPDLAEGDEGRILLQYWRLVFHANIHLTLARRRLDLPEVARRVRDLGPVVFDEAQAVLQQEQYLFDPDHTVAVYEEFAAVFLELRYFAPERLPHFFPAAEDLEAVERVFSQDIDAESLFRRLRPEGAADPAQPLPPPSAPPEVDSEPVETDPPAALRARADWTAKRGNQVRAALLLIKASHRVPPTQAGGLRGPARLEIERLVGRLQKALRFPERECEDWGRCLWALAERAAVGVWSAEMRLLSDLQKTCLHNERRLFAADLVESLVTWFRRPVQRPLPDLPLVLTVQDLRQAQHRLPVARMPPEERARLGELLTSSLAAAEGRLRDTFRPRLRDALDRVGLVAVNAAERLARDKLVEELLDDISQHGYLTIGDLRDAIARNRLKLPDVANPLVVLTGDPLIRLNRELARDLDGVYRRGELYLRWLQRLSSVFFGNTVGRLLTLYVLLPLLGSLFILKGIEGITDEVHHLVLAPLLGLTPHAHPEPVPDAASEIEATAKQKRPSVLPVFNAWSFTSLAIFLLLLFHVPPFRRGVVTCLWYLWRVVRGLLYDVPSGFFRLPIVRAVLQSKPYLAFFQFVGKPVIWTFPLALVLHLAGADRQLTLSVSAVACVVISLVSNTRVGLVVEETAADWLGRTWQLVRDDLVPGLFRWILWLSRRLSERVEKVRYTVEEWLLFRQGQSRLTFYLKVCLGLPWFVVSYVSRFVLMVLLEPQVNPIKHFPVVTVSHKLMLVIAPPIAGTLAPQLGWSFKDTFALVGLVFSLIPGLFGFLAWELKENWKLYRANQSPTLNPEMVGSHGERIINYIRPGFHSGTLPKLFARLRRARGATARKQEEGLHHVEEEVRRFIERELVGPLSASKGWLVSATVAVGHVHLATNEIRVELSCPGLGPECCWLGFVNRGGSLIARLIGVGWLAALDAEPQAVLQAALTGLYKRAGADLVDQRDTEPFPFAEHPVTWEAWVAYWEHDQAGQRPEPLVPGVRLLPA